MSDEKMPAVNLRSAKPVDLRARHPFSGDVLEPMISNPQLDLTALPSPATPPESFRNVIEDLKLRRAELDRAIDLLERLAP